ncbi:MAG: hypothetical protein JWN24_3566 [Phycisphaerales bacterium]|nr:hypothetical protein [Phycisphaerales bacterium]
MRLAFLSVITVCLAGCCKDMPQDNPKAVEVVRLPDSREAANLTFYDDLGNSVATARLSLPPDAGQMKSLTGNWRLLSSAPRFPRGSTSSGTYAGPGRNGGLWIDLNPGVADNNVILDGSIRDGKFSGQWVRATVTGGKPMGTFQLDLQPTQ